MGDTQESFSGLGKDTEHQLAESKHKTDETGTGGRAADAFDPFNSVASGLCFILENCEVRSPSPNAV